MVIDTNDDQVLERIATPSANTHRLTITTSGKKLFTENEEDASITVVDIVVSPRYPYVVPMAAARPALYTVDSDSHQLRGPLPLNDHHHNAQVVRFNHGGSLLALVGDGKPVVTLLDAELTPLASLCVGNKPMDGCFSSDNALLLIANEDDGTLSAIKLHLLQLIATPRVGENCEVLDYFPLADALAASASVSQSGAVQRAEVAQSRPRVNPALALLQPWAAESSSCSPRRGMSGWHVDASTAVSAFKSSASRGGSIPARVLAFLPLGRVEAPRRYTR